MNLLLTVASLELAYGGPARSVSRLGLELARSGLRVFLWAPDGSALRSPLVETHANLRPLDGSLEKAFASSRPDLVHDNGIWLPHNHRIARLCRDRRVPRLVSLRGMTEPWAFQHKRWKKGGAWILYQKRDLASAQRHHVTSEREGENLRRFGWEVPIFEIPNGVDLPEAEASADRSGEIRTALFIGRIYPVKGLPMLVEAWAKVRPAGWRLRLVGPDEEGHRTKVEAEVRRWGLESEVEFTGALEGPDLDAAYRSAELLILSSYTENFGMAAAEALAHGLPVIATQGTPWRLLETERCGWWVATSAEGLASGLSAATRLSSEELRAMGERGRIAVTKRFSWPEIAGKFVREYEGMAAESR